MENHIEKEPGPKDISEEFLALPAMEFMDFLNELGEEPELKIEIDWAGEIKAKRLKAFLEDPQRFAWNQKRTAAIRATEDQYMQALNVFASGVKLMKVGEWSKN